MAFEYYDSRDVVCVCVDEQFALTHPSYRYGTVNYGTNPDHARNSLFNCGMRQPEFGNKSDWIKAHRKRGTTLDAGDDHTLYMYMLFADSHDVT